MLLLKTVPAEAEAIALSNATASSHLRNACGCLGAIAELRFDYPVFASSWPALLVSQRATIESVPAIILLTDGTRSLWLHIFEHTFAALDLLGAYLLNQTERLNTGDDASALLMHQVLLAPVLEGLEALIPGTWHVRLLYDTDDSIAPTSDTDEQWWITAHGRIANSPVSLRISADMPFLKSLAEARQARPLESDLPNALSAISPDRAGKLWAAALPIPTTLHLGQRTISRRRLVELRIGDVLLGLSRRHSSETRTENLMVSCTVVWYTPSQHAYRATALWADRHTTFVTPVRTLLAMPENNDNSEDGTPTDLSVLHLDELMLTMDARIALPAMTLAQVIDVAPGYTIASKLSVQRAQVALYVNGQRWGTGELVSVDNDVGVLVTEVKMQSGRPEEVV